MSTTEAVKTESKPSNPQRTHILQTLIQTIRKGDDEKSVEALQAALPELQDNEEDYAQLCYVLFENREVFPVSVVLERFCGQYPASLHAVQAYLAYMWAEEGRYDEATAEARYYLTKVKVAGMMGQLSKSAIVQHGAGRAFLAATAAYTQLNWRSYSKRILRLGARDGIDLVPEHKETLIREQGLQDGMLEDPEIAAMDAKWERFYQSGEHVEELTDLCKSKGFQDMVLRMGILSAGLAFGDELTFETEFFQSVYGRREGDKTSYFLS